MNPGIGLLFEGLSALDAEGKTDGQLLEQFLAQRDQLAFAALVRRHGPMVLGVCRRILGNLADADDAFQAVFIVLVQKAAFLTSRAVVGDWLHGVARRIASKAKAATAGRRAKERTMARPVVQATEIRNDWLPLLDEELSRLALKYRLPILLCDLEGKTRQEAARQLGWPPGTVAGRLARGRALLAKRLLRRAQIFAGVSTASTAWADLPPRLVHSTLHAATAVAAGKSLTQAGLSAAVLTLAEGAVQTMFWQKMTTVTLTLLVVAGLAGAGGLILHCQRSQDKPAQKPVPTAGVLAAPTQPLEKKGPNQRDVAWEKNCRTEFEETWNDYKVQRIRAESVASSSLRWLQAQLGVSANKSEQMAAYKEHLDRVIWLEKIAKAFFNAGLRGPSNFHQTVYHRIQADIWLQEARGANEAKDKQIATERCKALLRAAQDQFAASWNDYEQGVGYVPGLCPWSVHWLEAQLKLSETKADNLAARLAHLERMKKVEAIANSRFNANPAKDCGFYHEAICFRLEAEVGLDEARDTPAKDTQAQVERKQSLLRTAHDQFAARWKAFENGQVPVDFVLLASAHWLKAQIRLCEKQSEMVAAYQAHLARLQEVEEISKALFDVGAIPHWNYHRAVSYRMEAEILLDATGAATGKSSVHPLDQVGAQVLN
jgi:RNA polymerase sigma factor (sigma-70 family)